MLRLTTSRIIPRSTIRFQSITPFAIRYRSNIAETAKETLNDVNLKVGQKLASGMEKGEEIVEKVGDVIQQSKPSADEVADKAKEAKDHVSNKAEDLKDKAKDVKDNLSDKAEDVKDNLSDKAEDTKDSLSKKAKNAKENVEDKANEAKRTVEKNSEGYSSLQDKGSRVEQEQSRPPDGI